MFAYKGTFTGATVTGNQTVSGIVDENGSSFTPKAVLVWSTFGTSAAFADGWTFYMGITDGTNQFATSTAASDNVASQVSSSVKDATKFIRIQNSAGTNQRVATISSFGSGQFIINWTTVTASAEIFHYIAFGGADLSVTAQNTVFDDNTATRSAITFGTLAGVLGLTAFGAPSAGGTGTAVGWYAPKSDGTFPQGVASPYIKTAANPSVCDRYQRTSEWKACFTNGSAGTLFGSASRDPLGDAWNNQGASGTVLHYLLAFSGIAMTAGSGLQPTSTGNQAISGLGFSPKAVILVSVGGAASTSVATDAALSLGGADRTRQGHAIAGSTNGVTPSVCVTNEDTTHMVTCFTPNATAASSTIQSQATVNSIDADGFTLNWGTADATQREYIWLAFGDVAVTSGGERSRTFVGTM